MSKTKIAKAFALVIAGAMVLATVGVATPAQAALSASDIQAIITALGLNSSQATALQSLTGATSGTNSGSCSFEFTKTLQVGSKGEEVKNLQTVLNWDEETALAVPAGNVGSAGHEGTIFGPATRAAVIRFQTANGINKTGVVGPITRAALNEACSATGTGTGTGTGTTPTPTPIVSAAGSLTVTAGAVIQPKLAPKSASRVPFTTIVLTAGASDVVVNGVNVQRTGQSQDASIAGIVLLDENGIQIGISKTLNSNHQVTVGEAFTVRAGTSRTLTIAGNMASSLTSYTGQLLSLTVTGVNVASGTVSGSFPIVGAAHTLNDTLTLGTAVLYTSTFDPNNAITKEIGSVGYRFSGIRVTAGSAEDVRLWSVRFNQVGSASSNDLANVNVYLDGIAYPTTISADGKYYTALFPGGIVLAKGNSKDFYIQGDIVGSGAANRTVQFDLYKNTDVYITGELYGYGIIGTPSSAGTAGSGSQFTSGTPFFDGSLVTINSGTVSTASKSASVPSQNIAVNVQNQVLGGYEIDLKGEPISVQSQVFHFTGSGAGSSNLLTNVSLYDANGAVVAGPVDAVAEGSYQKVTFTDTVTYPVGKRVYTVKGKVASGVSNNSTIVTSTTLSSDWTNITGQTTGNNVSLSALSSQILMNQMTVRTASLAVSMATDPTSQTIIAGGTARLFANIQLDANQSGEDVRLSNIPLTLAVGGSGAATSTTACQLFDGATALNTTSVVNPTAAGAQTFTLDQSVLVPKGGTKTLALKCNVSGNASSGNTFVWSITSAQIAALSVTGVTSSNTVVATGGTSSSGTLTIGSSSLTVALDPSSPTYAIIAAGSTNVPLSALKFKANNQGANLERIGLVLTNTASSSSADLVKVTIWDGATKVGEAMFNGGSFHATSTLSTIVALTKNTDKVLTIKADLAQIGSDLPAVSGHLLAVDYDANDTEATRATGADSGTVLTNSGSAASAGQRLFKSYPIFTYSTTGTTANNGAVNDLLTLNVTANANGEIALNKLTFTVSTTTATLTTPTFIGPSGSVGTVAFATPTTITVTFDSSSNTSDKYIAAGQTKSFTLRGLVTLTGTNTTGSVAVALKADTAFPSLSGFMSQAGDSALTSASIIWSPESTSTSIGTTANDWTNGYGLGGCFTNGLGSDCTVRTVSK